MPLQIVVIQGHPDPAGGHFCHALADAYTDGAHAGGHGVVRIEVAGLDFPLLRSQTDFERGPPPPAIESAQQAVAAADHLVIVYPLWLGTMPALLKAFLEQLFRPGFAFEYSARGFPKKRLKGRSARIVVTMGMPALVYRWYYGAHSLRSLERNVLGFCGIGPIREDLIGMVAGISDAKRDHWLARMRRNGARGV